MLRYIMKYWIYTKLAGNQSQSQSIRVSAVDLSPEDSFDSQAGCTVHWWKHPGGVAVCELSPELLSHENAALQGNLDSVDPLIQSCVWATGQRGPSEGERREEDADYHDNWTHTKLYVIINSWKTLPFNSMTFILIEGLEWLKLIVYSKHLKKMSFWGITWDVNKNMHTFNHVWSYVL